MKDFGRATDFAKSGWVALVVEYHGTDDGLYGDLTYPSVNWGSVADGIVELDLKEAVSFLLSNNPGQYGASISKGLIAIGASSGGHNAYMLALTDSRFTGAIGWSGTPDAADAGSAEGQVDQYMRTTPGSDIEQFGDPLHRLSSTSPPQYVANATKEFINPTNAVVYSNAARKLGVVTWLREPNTWKHAVAYLKYTFTGVSPEVSDPSAIVGTTVLDDSLLFASSTS